VAKQDKKIAGIISIKDEMSGVIKGIRNENKNFKKEVADTRKTLEKTYNRKLNMRVNNTSAMKAIKQVSKNLQPLKTKVVVALAHKDMLTKNAIRTINKVKASASKGVRVAVKIASAPTSAAFKGLKAVASPIIRVKDEASKQIDKIKKSLKSLASHPVVIGASIAGGAALAGAGMALKSGMELEQQQISMQHFIDVNNKDKSKEDNKKSADKFMKDLRDNANVTPFETGEVIQAGTRAVGLTQGDTKKAMELVNVAEDMAALNPGKTVQDAMEALADAKNGEYERLKEFNVKVGKEDVDKMGGFDALVDKSLKSQFEGGSAKLSESGAGLMSTITGKLKSNMSDTGLAMLENLKPVMKDAIGLIDSFGPTMQNMGVGIAKGIGVAATYLGKFGGWIQGNMPAIKQVASSAIEWIGNKFGWLKGESGTLKDILGKSWSGIKTAISTGAKIARPYMDILADGFRLIYNVAKASFPLVSGIIKTAWKVIKPILDLFAETLKGVAWGVGKLADGAEWLSNKLSDKGKGSSGASKTKSTRSVERNAKGSNYFKGGLSWVGEEGPELLEIPKGARILPTKESMKFASENQSANEAPRPESGLKRKAANPISVIKETTNVIEMRQEVRKHGKDKTIDGLSKLMKMNYQRSTPKLELFAASDNKLELPEVPKERVRENTIDKSRTQNKASLTIAKLADKIIVREEADIDKIAHTVIREFEKACFNAG